MDNISITAIILQTQTNVKIRRTTVMLTPSVTTLLVLSTVLVLKDIQEMVWIATVLLMLVLLMYERPHDGFFSNSNISFGYMLLVERLNLIVLNLKYLLLILSANRTLNARMHMHHCDVSFVNERIVPEQ